ncbi:hypothetical protein SNEBB_008272 [Seison nebaliae]|nr:hypothetical protein SNEBB_008272 [Seison nebaliae]
MEKILPPGWKFMQTLGEGAYAEVKLAISQRNEALALKIVNLNAYRSADSSTIEREICCQRSLRHDNIVRLYGEKRLASFHYLFIEYASGGELYDQIEPEQGMPIESAKNYFHQLINAVEYMHLKGITHRDLKPENILISANGTLKLADFGMSTFFRQNGKERLLSKECGTLPYVAPEVLGSEVYRAEPAELWTCAVILVAMVTGELPWDEPNPIKNVSFNYWVRHERTKPPWNKISKIPELFDMIERMLELNPSSRLELTQIQNHMWMKSSIIPVNPQSNFHHVTISQFGEIDYAQPDRTWADLSSMEDGQVQNDISLIDEDIQIKLLRTNLNSPLKRNYQLQPTSKQICVDQMNATQPTDMNRYMAEQCPNDTQANIIQTVEIDSIRRMTRIYLGVPLMDAIRELKQICKRLGYGVQLTSHNVLTITSRDRRVETLIYKAVGYPQRENSPAYIMFRLSRGDGLEFKLQFRTIQAASSHIAVGTTVKIPERLIGDTQRKRRSRQNFHNLDLNMTTQQTDNGNIFNNYHQSTGQENRPPI